MRSTSSAEKRLQQRFPDEERSLTSLGADLKGGHEGKAVLEESKFRALSHLSVVNPGGFSPVQMNRDDLTCLGFGLLTSMQ